MVTAPDPDQDRSSAEADTSARDAELLVRFQSEGDPSALSALYDRTAPTLLRIALYHTRHRADAEDLLQETYLTAIQKRRRFDPSYAPLAWLAGILHKHRKMKARSREREARRQGIHAERRRCEGEPADPLDEIQLAEFDRVLRATIASLPEPYGEVVRLSFEQELRPRELARALRRPAATVRSQLSRGLEMLRKRLPKGLTLGALPWLDLEAGLARTRDHVLAKLATRKAGAFGGALLGLAAMVLVAAGVSLWWLGGARGSTPVLRDQVASTPSRGVDAPASRESLAVGAPVASRPGAGPCTQDVRIVSARDRLPVAGAPVVLLRGRMVSTRDYLLPGHRLVTTTDERGVAHFPGLERGEHAAVMFDELGSRIHEFEIGAAPSIDLEVATVQEVQGHVLDSDGAPVGDAIVHVGSVPERMPGVPVARCDREGRFRTVLAGTSGKVGIWAIAPGHVVSFVRPMPVYQGLIEIDITLDRRTAPLRGRVVAPDADGNVPAFVAVPAAVEVRGLRPALVAPTATDGSFAIEGFDPAIPKLVVARARGYAPTIATFGDVSERLLLRLERGGTVAGSLVLAAPATRPGPADEIAGTMTAVQVCSASTLAVRMSLPWAACEGIVGEGGVFEVHNVSSGSVSATLIDLGAQTRVLASATLEVGGGTTRWHPDLTAGRAMQFRIVDDTGRPLDGAVLRLLPADESSPLAFPIDVVTDAQGRAEPFGLPEGEFEALVFPPLARFPATALCSQRVSTHTRVVRIVVPSARQTVQARAVLANGEPQDALLRVWRIGSRTGIVAKAAADGSAHAEPLAPGSYAGYLETETHIRWLEPFEIVAGKDFDCGVCVLEPFGSFVLAARGPGGQRVRQWNAQYWHDERMLHEGQSLPRGEVDDVLTVQRCAPGVWHVRIEAPGYCPKIVDVSVRPGARAKATVELVPGKQASLHVDLGHKRNISVSADLLVEVFDAQQNRVHEHKVTVYGPHHDESVVLVPGSYRVRLTTSYGTRAEGDLVVGSDAPAATSLVVD